jgi:hypothetical protein
MEIQLLRMCLNVTSSCMDIIEPYEVDEGIPFTPHLSSNHTIQCEGGNFYSELLLSDNCKRGKREKEVSALIQDRNIESYIE